MSQLHAFSQTDQSAPAGQEGQFSPAAQPGPEGQAPSAHLGAPAGPGAGAVPAPGGAPAPEQSPSGRSIKPVYLIAAAGAVVLVAGALALWLLFGGSGDGPAEGPIPTAGPTSQATLSPSASVPAASAVADVVGGRNPFRGGSTAAAVVEGAGVAGGAVTVTATQMVTTTATATTTTTATATSTVTTEPVYAFLASWNQGTGTADLVINTSEETMTAGQTRQGVTLVGAASANPSDCVVVRRSTTLEQATVCTGSVARFD